jgi:hypothetical protein
MLAGQKRTKDAYHAKRVFEWVMYEEQVQDEKRTARVERKRGDNYATTNS